MHVSFNCFWPFSLSVPQEKQAVLPIHFQPLPSFPQNCFLNLYSSFSHFLRWISWENVIEMAELFCILLQCFHHAVSQLCFSCFLLHLHSFNLSFSVSSPLTPLSVASLLSHHPFLWSLCLLSFFSPPLRLASSQRDGNPSDLPDRCEWQCAGADTSRGSGVWACSAQLQDQHHGFWCWCRPQRRALCLWAAFFSCQCPPQLDYFQT